MPRSKKPLRQQAEEAIQKLLAKRESTKQALDTIDAELASLQASLGQTRRAPPATPLMQRSPVTEADLPPPGDEAELSGADDLGPGRWV